MYMRIHIRILYIHKYIYIYICILNQSFLYKWWSASRPWSAPGCRRCNIYICTYWINIHICVYTYVYTYICIHIRINNQYLYIWRAPQPWFCAWVQKMQKFIFTNLNVSIHFINTYVYILIHTHTQIYIYKYMQIYAYIYINNKPHLGLDLRLGAEDVYIHLYILNKYIYLRIHICIYRYMHTYMHNKSIYLYIWRAFRPWSAPGCRRCIYTYIHIE